MSEQIESVEVFLLVFPRDTPYLGPIETGNQANEQGYFIRPGNRTVYSTQDQSILVKVTTYSGAVGWGETYNPAAPAATVAIIRDLLAGLVRGRDPHDVVAIYEDLYDAMRVRGFFGGYYVDALAGLDIALWDLRGQLTGLPLSKLLGGQRRTRIPAYVSGLPAATRPDRVTMAQRWIERGYEAVKFAAAVAHDGVLAPHKGVLAEMRSLRAGLGPEPKILVDMHWAYTAQEAIRLITALETYDLYLAEAPVQPEDLAGQAAVVRAVKTPVAIGEELRTVFEYRSRFVGRCMSVIQPEMGRMGVTAFWQVCQLARAFHCRVMPHNSIGLGLFLAASLHVSAALPHLDYHEYQHSIFDRYLPFIDGDMRCQAGEYQLPSGPGLGVRPNAAAFGYAV